MKHLNIVKETFECKQYLPTLPLEKARTLFRHKHKMTETVKMNYKNDDGSMLIPTENLFCEM